MNTQEKQNEIDAAWEQRQMAEAEEMQRTKKRGLNRPEVDFELNEKYLPKGK